MAHGNSRYPNEYKLAYALGAEKELLDEEIRKTIPYSTSNRWRQLNPLKVLGHENSNSDKLMQHIYSKLNERMQRDSAFEQAFRSFINLLQQALGGNKAFQDVLKDNRESVVSWVGERGTRTPGTHPKIAHYQFTLAQYSSHFGILRSKKWSC